MKNLLFFFLIISMSACQAPHSMSLTDIDGNNYVVQQFGELIWMTSNLQVTHDPTGKPLTFFYPNGDSSNKDSGGLLYNFEMACQACPLGWRLPTIEEWQQHQDPKTFAVEPVGCGNEGEFDNFFGEKALFWSKSTDGLDFVWTHIFETNADSTRQASQHPTYAFAVRCVKDFAVFDNRLTVQIPSAKMEADYIWQNLRDISFFEQHNYQVQFPTGKFIDILKEKARTTTLTDQDHIALRNYMTDSVYRIDDYQKGYERVVVQLPHVNEMLGRVIGVPKTWRFKQLESYQINLTLYGPGGSYHPHDGSIVLFTTPRGGFKSYKNPANTLIHELIHIGIEDSIIQRYQVPHPVKERMVDDIVLLFFGSELPGYRRQQIGGLGTEPIVGTKRDFEQLTEIAQQFSKK